MALLSLQLLCRSEQAPPMVIQLASHTIEPSRVPSAVVGHSRGRTAAACVRMKCFAIAKGRWSVRGMPLRKRLHSRESQFRAKYIESAYIVVICAGYVKEQLLVHHLTADKCRGPRLVRRLEKRGDIGDLDDLPGQNQRHPLGQPARLKNVMRHQHDR